MSKITRSELNVGMHVQISPQSDRSRKARKSGIIKDILTNSDSHPHGILVLLDSGEKGRVTALDSDNISTVVKNEQASETFNINSKIQAKENHNVEFKFSALWSSEYTREDIEAHNPKSQDLYAYGQSTSKIIIAKTLAGFLNTDGGTLIIGVLENKTSQKDEIAGIETDMSKLKDPCEDGYRRMLVDLIKDYFPTHIFNHFNQHLKIYFEEIESKLICAIEVFPSNESVFVNFKDKEHFFIRTDATTRELSGSAIVDFCKKRFS